jgi:hypothetical protein
VYSLATVLLYRLAVRICRGIRHRCCRLIRVRMLDGMYWSVRIALSTRDVGRGI